MPDIGPPHDDGVDELAAVADELKTSIDTLSGSIGALEKRTATNRRWNIILGSLVALKLATISVLIVVIFNLAHANQRIETSLRQNYTAAQQQSVTRVKVLCPLYSLLLASVNDPQTKSRMTAAQLKNYDANVKTITDGFIALNCPAVPH